MAKIMAVSFSGRPKADNFNTTWLNSFLSTLPGDTMITGPASQGTVGKYMTVPYLLMVLGGVIAAGSVAATFGTPSQWIGHAVTAVFGLLLLGIVILTGAILRGRIFRKSAFQVYPLHRASSIWFSLVVGATFLLGSLVMIHHGEPVLQSSHGILGLAITILAVIQLGPSLTITKRSSIRAVHRIVGYLLVVLYGIQIYIGLREAGIF